MKKYITILIIISSTSLCFSQSTKNPNIRFDNFGQKIYLPAAIKQLDKSLKYTITYPEKLSYHSKDYEFTRVNDIIERFDIDPKYTSKKDKADIIFNVKTEGIKIVKTEPETFSEKRTATYTDRGGNFSGFVYKFKYYFPITLEVLNKDGVKEKEFLFNSDTGTIIYHANFLLDIKTTESWKAEKMIVPFNSVNDLTKNYTANEGAILKRMEQNVWYYTVDDMRLTLELAYSDKKLSYSDFYYKTVTKKFDSDFPEIISLIKANETNIKLMGDVKTFSEGLNNLKANLANYDKLSLSANGYQEKARLVLYCNAAWCSLFCFEKDKAVQYLNEYLKLEDDEYKMYVAFKQLLYQISNYSVLKASNNKMISRKDIINIVPQKFLSLNNVNYD